MPHSPYQYPADGFHIARGLIPGIDYISKFGRNPAVGTSWEDVWAAGGTWQQSPTSTALAVYSDNAADNGTTITGALTLELSGLNASYERITETVTLNGTTTVTSLNVFRHLSRAIVKTAGTSEVNTGNISIRAVGYTTQGYIVADYGQTQIGIYQIPANYTGYIMHAGFGVQDVSANPTMDCQILCKPFGGAWNLKRDYQLLNTGSSVIEESYQFGPIVCEEKTIIKTRAKGSSGSSDVNATFVVWLVANAGSGL